MIPFRVKSLSPPCSPSSGYSYMYHAVDGRAPIVVDAPTSDFSNDELAFCSVVDIPWNGRSSKSRGIDQEKLKAAGDSFEIIAKRNGIKVTNPADKENKNENTVEMNPSDYFEILAKRNGIKVSSPDIKSETPKSGSEDSSVSSGVLSPTAKVFITRNNPYETVSVNASDEQELIEDVREFDAPGLLTAVGGYCVNGVDVLEGVKNVDALEMFEMILEEKKEFEWKQAQFFQEFIKKQSNSKKEIETLMADKQELQETVEALTSRLKALTDERDVSLEPLEKDLRQQESISKVLSENIGAMKERNTLLNDEIEVMTEKLMELKGKDARLNFEIETLTHKLNEHERTNLRLSNEVERMTHLLKELQKENERLNKEKAVMKQELRRYERMNTRKNCVDVSVQTKSLLPHNLPVNQPPCSAKKYPVGSMDCLDKITLNDDDDEEEDWTVVNHNKKATAKKEKTLCLPFAEKCPTVTKNYQSRRRKGSLCELPLDERLASSLNGSSKEASVELKSKGAPKFDLSCERDVAKPVQPKTDVVKGDDGYVISCVVQHSKSSIQSAHVDFKQEKPKERTFSSSIDDGIRSVTDKTSNSVDATSKAGDKTSCGFVATSRSVSRMSNMDGAMSISENAKMKTGVVTVNSDTKSSITETEMSTCKVADGLTSNIEAAVSDITTATSTADTTSTSVRGTMIGEDAVFTRKVTDCAIYGVSGAVIDTNLPVKQSLANLDYLAKQLGFGENWHQNIMKTCSILPVSTVPLPIFDTASCSPTMGQMLSGAKAMDVDKSRSMVGSCMGAASVVPPSTTYLLPGRPDSGTCSGNVKFLSCQNGNNQTSRVSGGTTNSGENTQQSNTDSFERLMLRLREKFPSKTRSDLVIYLKKAKSSFGEQGFRKKKLEEIVKKVGQIIDLEVKSNKMCCICRDVLENDQKALECGHMFHEECVAEWISEERTCPLCRSHALTQEDFPTLR